MKAIVCPKYGPPEVLQIQEVKKPLPKTNEILIKIHSTTATLYDCWQRSGTAPPGFGFLFRLAAGFRKPRQSIFGTELSGVIETVGKVVTNFKKGDEIFAYTGMKLGAYVEYICLTEDSVVAIKPNKMTFEEAAAVQQGALTALYFLRRADIQPDQKVLIFGASGGVGTSAVQLAKHFGAEVTGVASTSKLEFVKSLGADKVIDYTKEDFTENGETYDVIFDTVGKSDVKRGKKSLKEGGFYLFTTFGVKKFLQIQWHKKKSKMNVFLGTLEEKTEDLIFIRELIETGKFKSNIDKIYPMEQAAKAHRHIESGEKKGQVVITIA